jgi:DNA-3-methyladenine glycosylase
LKSEIPWFLFGPADEAAPQLLGWHLVSSVGGRTTEVILTEVEAYREDDPASHAFKGVRLRNAAMFGPAGTMYVYRSYGIHWCANVVCGDVDTGAAVLMRAGIPARGVTTMTARRGQETELLNGPGKLTQALGIDLSHNRSDLFAAKSSVRLLPGEPPAEIRVTPRIGISKAADKPWRFVSVL